VTAAAFVWKLLNHTGGGDKERRHAERTEMLDGSLKDKKGRHRKKKTEERTKRRGGNKERVKKERKGQGPGKCIPIWSSLAQRKNSKEIRTKRAARKQTESNSYCIAGERSPSLLRSPKSREGSRKRAHKKRKLGWASGGGDGGEKGSATFLGQKNDKSAIQLKSGKIFKKKKGEPSGGTKRWYCNLGLGNRRSFSISRLVSKTSINGTTEKEKKEERSCWGKRRNEGSA